MQGSVRKRGNAWYYSFELAKVDGKRKRVERKGGRTKKEAEASMITAMNEYANAGQIFDECELSVSDYLDYWYKNYVLVNLKYNSQKWYLRIIENHLKPVIGHYRLRDVTPSILQELINKKHLGGYSKNTLQNFKGVMSKSFKMAVHPYQFIKDNPMQYVTLPKQTNSKSKEENKTITTTDYNRILERFPYGSTFFVPLEIGFHSGLRPGEVCALTWSCVDFVNSTIRVEATLIMKLRGEFELGTPKTQSSYRTIIVSRRLMKILKQQQIDQKKNQLKYGPHYYQSDFVSTKENGEPVTTGTLRYLSRVVNHELQIDFGFHYLRHTHASLLLESGVDMKVIQERLGHSKMATTADTYAHITKGLQDTTAKHLEALSSKIV